MTVPRVPKQVVCSACGEHVYDTYAQPGDARLAGDMIPARPDVPRPQMGAEVVCPLCGSRGFARDADDAVAGRSR